MSSVAEQLRGAREAQSLSVQQVADMTKIRTEHIHALEKGDYSMFPAPIYIRGSVRNYATRLKLDVPEIMTALDAELGRTEKFSEPPPLGDETKTPVDHLMFWLAKVNVKAVFAGAVVLGIILFVLLVNVILRHGAKKNPAGNIAPAVYRPANNGDTLPLPKK